MQWISVTNTHENDKKEPKLDLLTMTEADRQELIKQIRECLHQRATEAKLKRYATAEDQAQLDNNVHEPETPVRNLDVLILRRPT